MDHSTPPEREQADSCQPEASESVSENLVHEPHNGQQSMESGTSDAMLDQSNSGQVHDQEQVHGTEVEGEAHDDGELGVEVEVEHSEAPKKKKSKKKRPASKRGQNKPTGMEEFFADAPMTAEQYEENKGLYDPQVPFIERILTAMQRFEQTRKLTPERKDVFYKWLSFGGVEIAPNMFQSKDILDTANMTKEELTVAMSQVSIGTDKHNVDRPDAIYAVDFIGCMKAFLSRRAVAIYGLETSEKILEITTTLERFMDYLLQHDVCAEYKAEVVETRNFCRTASTELIAIANAKKRLPGDFNIACSTIFGGEYARGYDGMTTFAPDTAGQTTFIGLTPDVATHIINFAVAGQAPEHIYQKHMDLLAQRNLTVIRSIETAGFEITHIEAPTQDTLDIYNAQAREYRPVGTLYAKPWSNPELPPFDLTPEERAHGGLPAADQEEYVFLIEQACLINLRVGMKIEATLHKVSSGLWFMDEFLNLYPTFDTYLVNELMLDYKKPRWLKGSLQYEEQEERDRVEEEARRVEEERREAELAAVLGSNGTETRAGGVGVDNGIPATGKNEDSQAVEDAVAGTATA